MEEGIQEAAVLRATEIRMRPSLRVLEKPQVEDVLSPIIHNGSRSALGSDHREQVVKPFGFITPHHPLRVHHPGNRFPQDF